MSELTKSAAGNITYESLIDSYQPSCAPPSFAMFRHEDGLDIMKLVHPEMSEEEAQKFIDAHTDENGVVILT